MGTHWSWTKHQILSQKLKVCPVNQNTNSRTPMNKKMKTALLGLVAATVVGSAALADQAPDHKVLVLKNKAGAAILGYDPVAYFTDNKPAKVDPDYKSTFEGADYYFA